MVNLGVSTDCHRDPMDAEGICVIIPYTRGGGLCLYEAKLVFNLQPGDILVFPSTLFTHFNLHIKGLRASFVFHSDKQWKRVETTGAMGNLVFKFNININYHAT